MKKKLFITSLLTSGLGFSLFAGLSAKKENSEVKADDYWSFLVTLDLTNVESDILYREDFDESTLKCNCWNSDDDNYDLTFDLHRSGSPYVYMAIAQFENSFSFDRVRFSFGEIEVFSAPYSLDSFINWESEYRCLRAYHTGDYNDSSQWVIEADITTAPTLMNNGTPITLECDDYENQFYLYNVYLEQDTFINFYIYDESEEYAGMIDDESLDVYFSIHGSNFAKVKHSGLYNVFFTDELANNGVIHIVSAGGAVDGSIYLVDVDKDTNVYVSGSFSELYGFFPGTRLGDIAEAALVLDSIKVSGSALEIWKIDLEIGYPQNEQIILSSSSGSEYIEDYSSSLLVSDCAYYMNSTGGYRDEASGNALAFLSIAEPIRLGALTDSICSITEMGANTIVNAYNSLSEEARDYVADVTINTYRKDGGEGFEDVSYKDVVETLGAKYHLVIVGSSMMNIHSLMYASKTAIIIICVSGLSCLLVVMLLLFRKKKQK